MLNMQEAYNKLLADFIIHLYSTHGIPFEISKDILMPKTPLDIHLIMLKHKDFCRGKC